MAIQQKHQSIAVETSAEIVIKGSRFLAHTAPVAEQAAAEKFISTISGRFSDATHNCFAYKIGTGDNAIFRYSDDGEPSGTAGRPILQAIESGNLTCVVIVVTRYFGGTKLGTGGLIRAYSATALSALKKAKILVHHPLLELALKLDYQFTKSVHKLVERFNGRILKTDFSEFPTYLIQIKAADEIEFKQLMQDLTKGKAIFLPLKKSTMKQ